MQAHAAAPHLASLSLEKPWKKRSPRRSAAFTPAMALALGQCSVGVPMAA
jgi:hypothetical protein